MEGDPGRGTVNLDEQVMPAAVVDLAVEAAEASAPLARSVRRAVYSDFAGASRQSRRAWPTR